MGEGVRGRARERESARERGPAAAAAPAVDGARCAVQGEVGGAAAVVRVVVEEGEQLLQRVAHHLRDSRRERGPAGRRSACETDIARRAPRVRCSPRRRM